MQLTNARLLMLLWKHSESQIIVADITETITSIIFIYFTLEKNTITNRLSIGYNIVVKHTNGKLTHTNSTIICLSEITTNFIIIPST